MTQTEMIRGNAWEEALNSHLLSHVQEERDLLEAYQSAADESQSSAFRYLVTVIIDEERRHHAMFAELGKTLQTEVEYGAEGFAVPRLGHWGFERQRILELTERFLAEEVKDDARLRALEAELGPVKDTTMWPLLVRLMRADSCKHVAILEFIKEHVERRWGVGQADWSGIEGIPS
jgi:rubrerythrin